MHRGRWVVYCIAVLSFFFVVQSSFAITLGMTATVSLSSLWKEALRLNSQVKIDTSHAHILLISQESLGIEYLPVDKQIIQLLVFKNNVLVNEQTKITNKKGITSFVFASNQSGAYFVIIVNKTEPIPYVVRSANISF